MGFGSCLCVLRLRHLFVNCVWVCACVVCVFRGCSLGLHLFGFVASATRHEFWIPGSPGAMILDRNCFFKFEVLFCEWVLVCVGVFGD